MLTYQVVIKFQHLHVEQLWIFVGKRKKEEGCCLLGVFNISLSLLGNHAMRIEIDYIWNLGTEMIKLKFRELK